MIEQKNRKISEKIADLNERVDWFYSEDFKLSEASKEYKEAVALAKEIEVDLKKLKNEIEVIEEDFSK